MDEVRRELVEAVEDEAVAPRGYGDTEGTCACVCGEGLRGGMLRGMLCHVR